MATLVFVHAHPDDESIATSGTMMRAIDAGHRVVLVVATRGEEGEPVPGVLDEGEELWQRRVDETHRSADIIGAHRVEFLGYRDSGMIGEPTNEHPECFWQADPSEAADRLAELLREENADLIVVYDDHGGYGHPDHIQVHRVGVEAARRAGVDEIYEVTINRTHIQRMMAAASGAFEEAGVDAPAVVDDITFGSSEDVITHAIDVRSYIERKRRSMEAHASQIGPESFFFSMPEEIFTESFGTEWYIRHGATRDPAEALAVSLLDGLI